VTFRKVIIDITSKIFFWYPTFYRVWISKPCDLWKRLST